MIVSLNEIETACYRAALGVGLSHGLAEDAAAIGGRLMAAHTDGAATMLRALAFADRHRLAAPLFVRTGKTWRPRHGLLPALAAGPVAADLMGADPKAEIDLASADEPAVIAACLGAAERPAPERPIDVPDQPWRDLLALAARTYVPQSETSRLMGAGAGLHDND